MYQWLLSVVLWYSWQGRDGVPVVAISSAEELVVG